MHYYTPLRLACPICGSKNSLGYRHIPLTGETETKCSICHSNWIDSRRLSVQEIKAEYRWRVFDDQLVNKRDRKKNR